MIHVVRALEFAFTLAILAGASYAALLACRYATRQSLGAGVVARLASSLILAALGYGAGLHMVILVGLSVASDYRAALAGLGWFVLLCAAALASVPWVALAYTDEPPGTDGADGPPTP